MTKAGFLIIAFLAVSTGYMMAQTITGTNEMFNHTPGDEESGNLQIYQDPALDTLISRYILFNENVASENDHYGIDGFRIQIYRSSGRNAREESVNVRAEFMIKFPEITSYRLYDNPGWFMVRIGDFRTKTEATKLFLEISKEYPDAYIVPDYIYYPDLNKD